MDGVGVELGGTRDPGRATEAMLRGIQTVTTGGSGWRVSAPHTPSPVSLQLWAAPSMNKDKPLSGVGRLHPHRAGRSHSMGVTWALRGRVFGTPRGHIWQHLSCEFEQEGFVTVR